MKSSMVDLKITKAEREERKKKYSEGPSASIDSPEYPYGTRIDLSSDMLKKIPGAKDLEAGQMVTITAVAKVLSKRVSETEKDETVNVELQMQKLAIDPDADEEMKDEFAKDDDKSDE